MRISVQPPFDLRLALFGHGFVDLAPHRWQRESNRFESALEHRGRAHDFAVEQRGNTLIVASSGAEAATRLALGRILRLGEDFSEFWRLCSAEPELEWVARRGAGRLMRSASLFEDLAKLLLTTNCSWAATRGMVARLVESIGERTPSGAHAFPSAVRCAEQRERFYRDTVRAGYRAPHLRALAIRCAKGAERELEHPKLSADELRQRLLALPGFGPYAAGQALRLLGHYEDLALDSWCRSRLAERRGTKKPPSDRAIARQYRRFGRYRGLALWMSLTARWHGEGPEAAGVSPLRAS